MAKGTPESLLRLTEALAAFPGIGKRTAERLAFFVIHAETGFVQRLAQALLEVKEKVKLCSRCFDLTEQSVCQLCQDARRETNKICVVEKPSDVRLLEATGQYRGLYHVLHGTISPLDGTGPDSLKVAELLRRLKQEKIDEVIVATNHNVEGDATAHYLHGAVRQATAGRLRITGLAAGIPIGGALAYTDPATLAQALSGRHELSPSNS